MILSQLQLCYLPVAPTVQCEMLWSIIRRVKFLHDASLPISAPFYYYLVTYSGTGNAIFLRELKLYLITKEFTACTELLGSQN